MLPGLPLAHVLVDVVLSDRQGIKVTERQQRRPEEVLHVREEPARLKVLLAVGGEDVSHRRPGRLIEASAVQQEPAERPPRLLDVAGLGARPPRPPHATAQLAPPDS